MTVLIVGPWLLPGYIFGTDFAGPRHFQFPTSATSDAALQAILAGVSALLPGELVGKALIAGSLFVAGLASYRAVQVTGFVPAALASLIFVVNPFVYDRLAYGQVSVLAGYAVLPLVVTTVRSLLIAPSVKRSIAFAIAYAAEPLLDVHYAWIAGLVVLAMVLTHVLERRRDRTYLVAAGRNLALSAGVVLVINAYWLAPTLLGWGPEASAIAHIGDADLEAFRTVPDATFGLLPNILGLYGFWGEQTQLYTSLKDFVPGWPIVGLALISFVVAGGIAGWRGIVPIESSRAWLLALVLAGVIAVVLEVGVADAHVAPLVGWLDSAVPPYRGMRDASKWGAILALAYSQLGAVGAAAVMSSIGKLSSSRARDDALALVAAITLGITLFYGNGVLYGLHGQVKPSPYPPGWYSADRVMMADPYPGRAVFLPWHGYLDLSFVHNENRLVANPAPTFFSVQVVASRDLEIPGVPPPDDVDQVTISDLVAAGSRADWAPILAAHGFKYVLVAREVDWATYSYLSKQVDLVLVADYGSILLYRNVTWTQPT